MSNMIAWIAAEAERPGLSIELGRQWTTQGEEPVAVENLPAQQYPLEGVDREAKERSAEERRLAAEEAEQQERERRIYRGRTIRMLRRYMRYSIETGRLPSLLGCEFFRAKVTSYTVVTFEDRVIFVHDMEMCLKRLDEFSRQLLARHILQEHDQMATSKLLHCSERTVRTFVPIALDLLGEILLKVGLLEPLDLNRKNSCQEGENDEISASDWEDGK